MNERRAQMVAMYQAIKNRHRHLLGWCLRRRARQCSHREYAVDAINYLTEDERLRQVDAAELARFTHYGYTLGRTIR